MMNNKAAKAPYDDAQTWVFWNIDDCPVPRGCKADKIAEKLRSALVKLNYRGPISISAHGNMDHIPPSIKKALSSTGILLNHVEPSRYGLNIIDFFWDWELSAANPQPAKSAPANVMLISSDATLLSDHLCDMRRDGYNTLLAHPQNVSDDLIAYAKTTWIWRSLLEEPEIIDP